LEIIGIYFVIGNHTDYNEGFVLSAAIDTGTYFLASPTNDGKVTIVSHNMTEEVVWEGVKKGSLAPSTDKASWSNYVKVRY
jgi:galactokinase